METSHAFPTAILPLPTARLTLRRFAAGDLLQLIAYRNDPVVGRYQGWSTLSPEEGRRFIAEMGSAVPGVPGEWFQVAIARQADDLLVGDIGFCVDGAAPSTVEIGFTLARDEQGKGYAREAVGAWIDCLFEQTGITTVLGITDLRNEPSRALLQRLGLRLASTEEREFRGEPCVEETYRLTRAAWDEAREG